MKKTFIIMLLILTITLVGCGNDKNITNNAANVIENIEMNLPEEDNVVESTDETETTETEVVEEVVEEAFDPTGKIFSKLTGLEITEEQASVRPIAVMIDNQYKARPQAGLSDAEVVYEILAEGTITRYMAIFQAGSPEVIGPVRSSRPYYIQRALEFNPLYVHVGGSMQALTDIINLQMGDIDGLSVAAGVFYRTTHKNMPHNAYTSHDGIRKEADRKKHFTEVEFAGMPISYEVYDLASDLAEHIKIAYKEPSATDSIGYSIEFKYDPENKNYLRYVNGIEHLDEETEVHLTADNIIIQTVNHKVLDSAGRRELTMIGSGKGYYVNKGMYIPMTWKKSSTYEQTKYYYEDGTELILNPGITWIQVISPSMAPIIE